MVEPQDDVFVGMKPDSVQKYLEIFRTSKIRNTSKRTTYKDFVKGRRYVYDFHKMWSDRRPISCGIPLTSMLNTKNAIYEGSIMCSLNVLGEIDPFGTVVPALEVYYSSLEKKKFFFFHCDEIRVLEYEGDFAWGNRVLSKYVKGHIVYVRSYGQWKILDASIGGTFADRYMKLAAEGFPVPKYEITGRSAVQFNLGAIGVVLSCVDQPLDDDDGYLKVNTDVVFSAIVGRGIIFCGGDVKVDGTTPFFYFDDDDFGSSTTVKDSVAQWRVRYRDEDYCYIKGFFFKVVPDNIVADKLTPGCAGVFAPKEWKDKLWDVIYGEF